jgi:hypothetical protein
MKLGGKKISGANEVLIPIPRGEDDQIVLKARAVIDFNDFEKLCPRPQPRQKMVPGGRMVPFLDDPKFIKQVEDYSSKRTLYMILTSLRATEGLEWETVDYDDSDTWDNYEKELKEAGFSEIEIGRIVQGVMSANGLDEAKIDEARNRFLAQQLLAGEDQSSQAEGQVSTPSGEPAKD